MPTTDPTPTRGDETPVDALLTGIEWESLGSAMVPDWDNASPTAKKIWRGFARDLAIGYRLGLAAGRTAAAADIRAMPGSDDRFEQRRTVVMRCARVAENGADR